MYGRLCVSFLPVSACSWVWSWNTLLVVTMRDQQSPNHSAWKPAYKGCPCHPVRTLEQLFKDSRNNRFQTAHRTALQEPKWVSGTENAAIHGFVLDLIGKEGKYSAATSCLVLCRSVIGGVHPFPHGPSSTRKLPPATSTTRLRDSGPGTPDGRRLPKQHRARCASPPLLGAHLGPLCLLEVSEPGSSSLPRPTAKKPA